MREWEQFIPEEERKIYEKAGYKNKDTFGRNPALLIIDVITGFTGTKAMDIMDAIDEFATDFEKLATEFPDMIKPKEGEFIVRKARASAFFGTHLITYLVRKNIDCLLVTGTSTCGCVRGTVLDGYSFGYPVFLVEECVFDRSRTSHLVNLYEMNAKYATVIQLNEALNYVQRLRKIEGRQALVR